MGATASSTTNDHDSQGQPPLTTAAIEKAVYTAAGEEISRSNADNSRSWIDNHIHTIPSTDPYWELSGFPQGTAMEYSLFNALYRVANSKDKSVEMKRLVNSLPKGRGFGPLVAVFVKQLESVLLSDESPSEGSIAACIALSVILRLVIRVLPASRMPILHTLSHRLASIIGNTPSSSLSQYMVGLYSSLFELLLALWRIHDDGDNTRQVIINIDDNNKRASSSSLPYMDDFINTILDDNGGGEEGSSMSRVIILLLRCIISPTIRLKHRAMQLLIIMLQLSPRMRHLGPAVFSSSSTNKQDDMDMLLSRASLQLIQELPHNTNNNTMKPPLSMITLYTLIIRSPTALASLQARTDSTQTLLPLIKSIYEHTTMIKGRSAGGGDSGGIQQQYDASQLLALKVVILLLLVRQEGCSINASHCWIDNNDDDIANYKIQYGLLQSLDDDSNGKETIRDRLNVSSILVLVLIRVARCNYAESNNSKMGSSRNEFLTITIAATLHNLAKHTITHLHWYACQKLLHFTKLLLVVVTASSSPPSDDDVDTPDKLLLQSLLYLIITSLSPSNISTNIPLVYSLLLLHPPPDLLLSAGVAGKLLYSMYTKLEGIVSIDTDDDDWLEEASLHEVVAYISQCIIKSGAADVGRDALGFMDAIGGREQGREGWFNNRIFDYKEYQYDDGDSSSKVDDGRGYYSMMLWSIIEDSMMFNDDDDAAGLRYICWTRDMS